MAQNAYRAPSAPYAPNNYSKGDNFPPPPKYKQRNNIKGVSISEFMKKYNIKKNLLVDENFCQIDDYDFTLLIDDSSSMNIKNNSHFSKWDCNKNTIIILFEFLRILNQGSVNVWFLNRDNLLNNSNINHLSHSLNFIPFGRTSIDTKLLDIFQSHKNSNKKKFIIIISDCLSTNNSGVNKNSRLKEILKNRDKDKFKIIFVASDKDSNIIKFKMKNIYYVDPYNYYYNYDNNVSDTDNYTQADYCIDIVMKGLTPKLKTNSIKKKLKNLNIFNC